MQLQSDTAKADDVFYWYQGSKHNLRLGLDIEVFCDDGKIEEGKN